MCCSSLTRALRLWHSIQQQPCPYPVHAVQRVCLELVVLLGSFPYAAAVYFGGFDRLFRSHHEQVQLLLALCLASMHCFMHPACQCTGYQARYMASFE